MEECIFCKIVRKEVGSFKIYEDEDYYAFLDLFPLAPAQTLVIPKKHIDSYIFNVDDEQISEIMGVAKKVAKILEKGMKTNWVSMAVEGLAVNHLHVKLYPYFEYKDRFVKYKTYFGMVGDKATDEELSGWHQKIVASISGK